MDLDEKKLMTKFQQIEHRRKIQFIVKDTVLVSYPKSGRTWLRMMMAKSVFIYLKCISQPFSKFF